MGSISWKHRRKYKIPSGRAGWRLGLDAGLHTTPDHDNTCGGARHGGGSATRDGAHLRLEDGGLADAQRDTLGHRCGSGRLPVIACDSAGEPFRNLPFGRGRSFGIGDLVAVPLLISSRAFRGQGLVWLKRLVLQPHLNWLGNFELGKWAMSLQEETLPVAGRCGNPG